MIISKEDRRPYSYKHESLHAVRLMEALLIMTYKDR